MDLNDTTLEIFPAVPDEHSLGIHTESIYTVMMQPVTNELAESLPTPNEPLILKCDFCDEKFRLASRLKLHAKIHSDTVTEDPDEDRVSSGFKQDNSGRVKNIKSGLKLRTNEAMQSKFNQNQSKPNAKLTHHTCKFCDKRFATHAHLSRHTHVHTGVRPFKCEKCHKAFKDVSVLKRHLRIHSCDRPYCCEICKKSFIQSKDLQHHIRSHSGDQPYMCQTCNKCFSSASYLTVHKRIHTGVKPHVCPICYAGFHASGTLARHQRSHSTEKQFRCSVCPKAFTRSTNLRQHIQAEHSDE